MFNHFIDDFPKLPKNMSKTSKEKGKDPLQMLSMIPLDSEEEIDALIQAIQAQVKDNRENKFHI